LEFRVLGDLEVSHDGLAVPLGAHQQRAVLAMLVLHPREVISVDRLIEGVWGEHPPARATKAVHVHVWALRTALAVAGDVARDELIATRDHGYMLCVADDQIDARLFEQRLDAGRQAHHEQAFEEAAAVLAEALALWRGSVLADFTFDPFAGGEIARLNELRLEALELRIDADLALGRHAAATAELEALAAEHPLRERLQRQRMLALYRCGRQSEALAVYRETRALLVDELGIEPSPETRELHEAVLRQDHTLDPPTAAAAPARTAVVRARPWRVWLVAAAAACVVALAAGIAIRPRGADAVVGEPNSVAVIDPAHNAVVHDIPVGARPANLAAGAGGLWVANVDDRSLSEIDPVSSQVTRTLYPRTSVDGLAADARALWIVDYQRAVATRLDPAFGESVRTVRLGATPIFSGGEIAGPTPIAVAGGAVWATTSNAAIAHIGARSGRPSMVSVGNEPAGIAIGGGAIWASDDVDSTVARIDTAGVVNPTVPVGEGAGGIATGAGAVWVANSVADTVTKIDLATGAPVTTIPVGAGPRGVAVGLGAVWVANSRGASVSRIDPRTNTVRTIPVGQSPENVAVTAGRVWVTLQAAAPPLGAPVGGGTLRIVKSDDFGSTDPAIMHGFGTTAYQLEYATCAKLVNYPDEPGARGLHLAPEVASAMPAVSRDGRTYRFTVRSGYHFGPPSGRPVTAFAFQRALERFLSPKMRADGDPILEELRDIMGVGAYRAGRTRHVAGITATSRTLTIHLARPSPSLPARLAMPYFCAVPSATPIRPGGVERIPSAGPYYIASRIPGRELLLKRNPNYRGQRPHRLAAIEYRFGATAARESAQVKAGDADYVDDPIAQARYASAVSPAVDARLEREYGSHSVGARSGRQRYFINPTLSTSYLQLNRRRPLFADVRMRRAANFAVDRAALARTAQPGMASRPTDQLLPAVVPGYRDANLYPLGGGDVARARGLAGTHGGRAVMYTCSLTPCVENAETVQANLAAIGISVAIKRLPFPKIITRLAPGQPYDIAWSGWGADYADPAQFINPSTPGFDPPGVYRRRIAAADRLSGNRRLRAFGRLDVDIAAHDAPIVAFATTTARDFFSARVGCQVYQPIYGMDLGALCVRNR
jgi:YVTN family beta-propeller protein